MRLLTFAVLCAMAVSPQAQNSITATYNIDDIPTSLDIYDSSCNGPVATLSLMLPAGENYEVTHVDVAYNMTALSTGFMSHQRSKIRCVNTGIEEDEVAGVGNTQGTFVYMRTIDIANGVYFGGTTLTFEMWARRTSEGVGCNTSFNRVNATTWTITVYFGDENVNPKVGVNVPNPVTALDIGGKIRISDDSNQPVAGMIRWNESTQDFEGFNGNFWVSLTKTNATGGWGQQAVTQTSSAVLSQGDVFDFFGRSVAISEDYAFAGAPNRNIQGNENQGLVVVFQRLGNTWPTLDTLVASDGKEESRFGNSMAISGDYLIIGAPDHEVNGQILQGQAYIFHRIGDAWTEQAILSNPDGASNDQFGFSVSISGDYAIVGAPYENIMGVTDRGAAYIFHRNGNVWTQQEMLLSSDGDTTSLFGFSVSIAGDYAIVGAPAHEVNGNELQGKAYIFRRTGTNWEEQADLFDPDGAAQDVYGRSIAISGDLALVGTRSSGINVQGAVMAYQRDDTEWFLQSTLMASDGAPSDWFGFWITFEDDIALIGAPLHQTGGNVQQGKAYVFQRHDMTWSQQAILISSDGAPFDLFGLATGMSGDFIIVGASGHTDEGKVYFYHRFQ